MAGLHEGMIDAPIVDLVNALNRLSCCFTLQCCYGHFLYAGQEDPHNLEPLPVTDGIAEVQYRIAYICLCVEDSAAGRALLAALREIPAMDPDNVQLCSADWFWERQVNSYALQVEPDRFKDRDTATLGFAEALQIEKLRNELFARLVRLVRTL